MPNGVVSVSKVSEVSLDTRTISLGGRFFKTSKKINAQTGKTIQNG